MNIETSGYFILITDELNGKAHKRCINPKSDVSSESLEIQDLAAQLHTPEAIADYQAKLQAEM